MDPTARGKSLVLRTILTSAVCILASCTTLITPAKNPSYNPNEKGSPTNFKYFLCNGSPPNGTSAIAYATMIRDDMQDKAEQEISVSRIGGSGLMLLGGVVGYKAGAGLKNTHNLLALTAGGTALYGVGTILTSQDRINTYVAGANAVQCAINLAAPFLADPEISEPTYTNEMQELRSCMVDGKCLVESACNTKLPEELLRELQDAHNKVLAYKATQAGMQNALCAAVDNARMATNKLIAERTGDIASMSVRLAAFSTPLKAPNPTEQAKASQSPTNLKLRSTPRFLECTDVDAISEYVERSKYLPQAADHQQLLALAQNCTLGSIDKTLPLEIKLTTSAKAGISLKAVRGKGYIVVGSITGGSGVYAVSVASQPAPSEVTAGTISQDSAREIFIVVASDASATGEVLITAKDNKGLEATASISLVN